jgi:hypothetical protein
LIPSVTVSTPTGPPGDDAFWRRPEREDPSRPDVGSSPAAPEPAPPYAGPPRADPPPYGWRPPLLAQPPQPRELPEQDQDALDQAESSARTVTYGISMVAGAILLIVTCLLCSRLLF